MLGGGDCNGTVHKTRPSSMGTAYCMRTPCFWDPNYDDYPHIANWGVVPRNGNFVP